MDIKEKLKLELKKSGLKEGLADILTISEESEIQGVVEQLQQLNKPSTLDDVLKDPAMQSEFDKRVAKSNATVLSKIPKPVGDPAPTTGGGEVPEWKEALEKLQNELRGTQSKLTVRENLSKSKLPKTLQESWATRIDANSETPIQEQITVLESEYSAILQSSANGQNLAGTAGGGGSPKTGLSDDELTKYM